MQIYITGGFVRDKILNNTSHDKDYVVVGSTIEEMLSLGFIKVGKTFPVFLHPTTKEEYALARKEIKTGKRHQDFEFIFTPDITLKEDSLRRDFTCNAIYEDITTGKLIDYHNGIKDIQNKILRHISPHFKEDPLRLLRACRFVATLNFTLAPETVKICKQMVEEGALSHLSKERIFQELEKSLCSPYFYRFIETARQIGLLKVLLPEVEDLWQIPERADYHPEKNTGQHTILALKSANSKDPITNLAILLHDIGKTKTDKTHWPSHHHHETLGIELAQDILKRLDAPNLYKNFIPLAIEHHMIYHNFLENNPQKLVNLCIKLAKHKRQSYYERFKVVINADMHGRALPNFIKEEQEFENFIQEFDKYYNASLLPKPKLIKNFSSLLEQLKNKELTKEDLTKIETKAIIEYVNS